MNTLLLNATQPYPTPLPTCTVLILFSFPSLDLSSLAPSLSLRHTMTSVLLPPRPLSYASQSPTGGILLNPSPYRQTSTLPQPSYPSRSNQSLASTSSSEDVNTPSSLHATPPISLRNARSLASTSDEDRVLHPRSGSAPEYGNSGSRRIRFAPLPDPRRAVLVTEHGEELPLPSVFDDDDPSGIPRPNLRNFRNSPSSSLLLGDDVVATKEVPTITSSSSGPCAQAVRSCVSSPPSPVQARVTESPTPSTATITSSAFSSSSSSARFAKRLLFPFRVKTDGSCRSGSRDSSSSRDGSPPSWSIPLSHWVSAPEEGSRSTSTNGDSLSRGRSATATTQSKPKRMLNGRVYGARKHHRANLFDNIPDEEPEFVEWGYGGMGSVGAGGVWAKVQSDRKFFDGGGERGRRGASNSGADAEDDGSGMGWVKKRREERERKKREEQAAQQVASKTNAISAPAPVSDAATAHASDSVLVGHDITTVTPAPLRPEDDDDSSDEGDEEVEDESSSTEQEDDADEVGLLVPSHYISSS